MARRIPMSKRSPKNSMPIAKSAICVRRKRREPPIARPITKVSWVEGVSHEGSSVPASCSLRRLIAMPQKAVAIIPLTTPPRKMKPARLSVPIEEASPRERPPTANAAPKRKAGMTP